MAKDKEKDKDKGSALKVTGGVEQPYSINANAARRYRKSRSPEMDPDTYIHGILQGNRMIVSRAITLIESALPKHHELAQEIIAASLPHSGNSVRIGITGVPGVGKSTFIEALGKQLTSKGHKIAVLAIDPSSQRSKGSILGDKTRMEELASDPNAYIRPSSSTGSLGGVARKTREAITVCEAAGYDVIFVETVGVGQSETAVHAMVDFFLLLMLAGAGDELQGIKRGIMEMADAIVINKADGDNKRKAELAKNQYEKALHLFPPAPSGWTPVVRACSSVEKTGVHKVWDTILNYIALTKNNGYFYENRNRQAIRIMYEAIDEELKSMFYSDPAIRDLKEQMENAILKDKISAYVAARRLLEKFLKTIKEKKD